MADFMQGEISADEQFGAPAEKPVMQQIEEQGQQPSPTGEVSADAQFGRAAPPAPFPTIDEGATGFFGPQGAGAAAGKAAFQMMEMPLNVVQAGLQEIATRGPQDFPERVRRSLVGMKDQFGLNPPPTLNMGEILAEDLIKNGMDPELAMEVGNHIGPVYALGVDPLTYINAPFKGARMAATEIAKAARSTPSPQAIAEIAMGNPQPSMADRILGWVTTTPKESINVLKTIPERVHNARPKSEVIDEVKEIVNTLSEEKRAAQDLVRESREYYNEIVKETRNDFANHKLPPEVLDQFMVNMRELRQRTSVASGKAFDVLEESGRGIGLDPILKEMDKMSKGFKIGEVDIPKGMGARAGVDRFESVRQLISLLTQPPAGIVKGRKLVPAVQVKQLVQTLDDEIGSIYDAIYRGESVSRAERSLLTVRGMIDDQLKKIPEYAEAMKPLAKDTSVLKKTRDLIRKGDDPSRIFTDEKLGRPILTHFDEAFQTNYLGEMDKYLFTQKAKRDSRIFKSIPEIAAAEARWKEAKDTRKKIIDAERTLGPWTGDIDADTILQQIARGEKGRWVRGGENLSRVLSEDGVMQRNILDELVDSMLLEQLKKVKPDFDAGKVPKFLNVQTATYAGGGTIYSALAGDPAVMGALIAAAGVAGIGTIRQVFGPKMAKAFVEASGKKLAKATVTGRKGKLKGLQKLIFDGDRAINIAPNIVNHIVQPNSDLNVSGKIFLTDPDQLEELRLLTMSSKLQPREKAQIMSAINGGIVEIELDDDEHTKERKQERFKERNKMNFESLNKVFKKFAPVERNEP